MYNSSPGSRTAWLPTEMTEANRHGKLSTGVLWAEHTRTVPRKNASSAIACRASENRPRVVDRLTLTTS